MKKLQEAFELMIEEQQAIAKKFKHDAEIMFKDITKQFFDINPGITAVIWSQYTPYFNDGSPCEFGVNEPTYTNASSDELDNISYGEYSGEDKTVWATESINYVTEPFNGTGFDYYKDTRELILQGPPLDLAACYLMNKMITSSEFEPVLLALFGDGVSVTATIDGFDVSGYEHD
jgi:hypothetical protein